MDLLPFQDDSYADADDNDDDDEYKYEKYYKNNKTYCLTMMEVT